MTEVVNAGASLAGFNLREPRTPRFQWGQPVVTLVDLLNDGSYPDLAEAALLAEAGARGEVVNVGMVEDSGIPVYLVEFADGKVIGVLEEELAPV
ncbi:nitrogen fixation protein NifZ [Methylophilus glucosoxydans]|uniref:Nitrogen fixation protein NifZ n=1 Tax=Methylophilus glucosoxydans TaxID=752553 RepID=A0ABW3GK81_9PROT|nr:MULTISPECIES: nitrogen fixation protein NifZ [unclassified Methylophilus]MBF5038526.1 nitrogen fixation protein NifZ [Methylophilus sp. 13]MDT7848131.1 nitrogen fixation protein NifZ [Methylophilus sp. VKM B-3414]